MSDKSKCRTCGYEWNTGQDGSHSCSEVLNKEIVELKIQVKEIDKENNGYMTRLENKIIKIEKENANLKERLNRL